MPAVSIIIPTYNRANDLEICLSSLVSQTFKDFEVIVSDDGSTDNSREVANSFSDQLNIQYIYSENFGGPARPRNLGIRAARGAYIAFLDADDTWLPDKLEKAIKKMDEGFDLVYHGFYKTGKPIYKFFPGSMPTRQLKHPVFLDLLATGNIIINSGVVVRKEVLEQVGDISEERDAIAAEDFDYWLRISRVTNAFAYIPEKLGYYQVSGDGISRNAQNVLNNLNYIKKKYPFKQPNGEIADEPQWMKYYYARVYYKLRNKKLLSKYVRKLLYGQSPAFVKLKALYMLVLVPFR